MDQGITFQDVTYRRQDRLILRGISLSLTARRIGVIGRNGSGKTTLLRLMAGLVAPSSGQIRLDGLDPAADRRAMLDRVGILFQNPDHQILFPTVEEELAFGLRQQGASATEAAAEVATLLQAEGRSHWAKALVASLSHGQKQWLCLMAVLLMRPATLLLDEPFAALDLPTQARLARRLAVLPQRIVTISHDPDAVAAADHLVWIEGGEVARQGRPADVLPAFRAEMARLGDADADTDLSH
ncbi:energy-coupling factor ABC transporter ATP-binding protein [Gemmobacter denitrificans]|uniref:ABC transporter ATP-binding protein n=1 Tax=Gemmobacter denitrificans TaxID=3123040 RepID=A0ABU8BRW3_9RHOB